MIQKNEAQQLNQTVGQTNLTLQHYIYIYNTIHAIIGYKTIINFKH